MKNLSTGLLVIALLTLIGLACSKPDASNSNSSANTSSNSSTTDNKNTSSSNTTGSTTDDLTGKYGIAGKNLKGQAYTGELAIRKQDEVYQFSWNVGGSSYDGVGVREGELVVVGYGAGDNGKGCGAAIYKVGEKMLEGKLGGWGYNKVGHQTAILLEQKGKGGVFTITGKDTDGSDYTGNLYVTRGKAEVYHLAFSGGNINYIGTGVKVGDYFGVGMGVKECGYIVYDIKSTGLEAAWGVIGSDRLGTEVAVRQ